MTSSTKDLRIPKTLERTAAKKDAPMVDVEKTLKTFEALINGAPTLESLGLSKQKSVLGARFCDTRFDQNDGAPTISVWEDAPYAPRSHSITEFVVPESLRGQGVGRDLLKRLFALYDPTTLCAAASSAASVKLFYESGFRPTTAPCASLDESIALMRENSSVTMAVPLPTQAPSIQEPVNTVLCDSDGAPTIFYHGSPNPNIEIIEQGHTAYGIFFTPDKDTARYYASGSNGCVYSAYLKINKLADLDEIEVFETVMREAIDFEFRRDDGDARAFAQRLYDQGYGKNEHVTAFFNDQPGFDEVDGSGYTIAQLLDDNCVDAGEIDDLIDQIGLEHVTQAYNAAAPAVSQELEWAREAYGSEAFYLNYQDDFMRAAQALGYDAAAFTDPSSTGNPISYVVFDSEQVILTKKERVAHAPIARCVDQ